MKAYKFVSEDVADLVERGSVRLAAAQEFRREEDQRNGRGDRHELLTSAKIAGGSETARMDDPIFPDDMFVFIKGGKRIHVEMEFVGDTMQSVEDALLYCCSLSDTPEIRAQMAEIFGATAVFEISDIEEFQGILGKQTELSFRDPQHGRVTYAEINDGKRIADLQPVDAFLKDVRFAWQDEYRLVWAARFGEGELILQVPELCALLRRID